MKGLKTINTEVFDDNYFKIGYPYKMVIDPEIGSEIYIIIYDITNNRIWFTYCDDSGILTTDHLDLESYIKNKTKIIPLVDINENNECETGA